MRVSHCKPRAMLIAASVILAVTANAYTNKYEVGLRGEMVTLSGGASPKFTLRKGFGASLSYRFAESWIL
ncbi:MAG: hypothetical protein ACE5K8_00185, partial [Candidatus Zixiibacteriota bacterium]